ncbi:MAG: DUF669 domain-containing protein [Planctomycetota bacterium]
MADLGGQFDATNIEPNQPMKPLPAGEYICTITASEKQENKKRTGYFLKLTLTVQEGEHKGRTVIDRLNMWNPNQQASAIAQGQLSAICHATSVMKPKDSVELHGIPMKVTVDCARRTDDPSLFGNNVKGYAKRSNVSAAATPEPQAAGGPPPWQKS